MANGAGFPRPSLCERQENPSDQTELTAPRVSKRFELLDVKGLQEGETCPQNQTFGDKLWKKLLVP